MQPEHKTPWRLVRIPDEDDPYRTQGKRIRDDDHNVLCTTWLDENGGPTNDSVDDNARASRIVTCVNEFDGIINPTMFMMNLRQFMLEENTHDEHERLTNWICAELRRKGVSDEG